MNLGVETNGISRTANANDIVSAFSDESWGGDHGSN